MSENPSLKIKTFGCKVNTYDTGLMQKKLQSEGFNLNDDCPDVYLLNTCAVTAEASREAVREVRRFKSRSPLSKVVVTGCAAQVDTGLYDQLPGVDLVVANSHKGMIPLLIKDMYKGKLKQKVFKSNIFRKLDLESGGGEEKNRTRAFLKIQDGCNSFCSFCVIPYARGKSRSLSARYLLQKVNDLKEKGFNEVVLTGIHIGDYVDEDGHDLTQMLRILLNETQNIRFRLTSVEPPEVSDELLELFSNDRLCPHFHMSIQSMEDHVLRSMKRKYTVEETFRCFERIHRSVPNAFIGLDIIVGFPTEGPKEFETTYKNLEKLSWTRAHVFPYSERSGTAAARLEDLVPRPEKKRRSKLIRDLSSEKYRIQSLNQYEKIKNVLVLKNDKWGCVGVAEDFWRVQVDSFEEVSAGQIFPIKITGGAQDQLEGPLYGEFFRGKL